MSYDDELVVLKIAYANCVNDLRRTQERLKQAEDTLFNLAELLRHKANDIQAQRFDNPGMNGSGK